jgi:hypothetical protein
MNADFSYYLLYFRAMYCRLQGPSHTATAASLVSPFMSRQFKALQSRYPKIPSIYYSPSFFHLLNFVSEHLIVLRCSLPLISFISAQGSSHELCSSTARSAVTFCLLLISETVDVNHGPCPSLQHHTRKGTIPTAHHITVAWTTPTLYQFLD